MASLLGARAREVVFTSGGTESVNSAVAGAVERGRRERMNAGDTTAPHVVTTAVEHSSVHEALERAEVEATVVGVDRFGRYDAEDVVAAVRHDTVLVSVQTANHEVGTRQPWRSVAESLARRPEEGVPDGPLLHVDACADTANPAGLAFVDSGVDLCSVTAHKAGGPAGIGALLVRRGLRIPPLVVGGAQERDRRGGLENVAAAVGFGTLADDLAESGHLENEAAAARRHTDRLTQAATSIGGVSVFGDSGDRMAHLVCLGVEGVEAEPILLGLDQRGVAVHSGSSCSSETLEPSPVLRAMGVDTEHSLRISVGWNTTDADVDLFARTFSSVVEGLRSLRS